MNPIAAFAVKLVSGGTMAALLTLGVTANIAQASTLSSAPSSPVATAATPTAPAGARDAIRYAIFESEADVLRIPLKAFRVDVERGITVAQLARERGLDKARFADRLIVNVRPRLEQLVDLRVITPAQADVVLARIHKGYIPWWDGLNK